MKTTYHITPSIYEELANRCDGSFTWDCIELADGFAVVFACKSGKPYDVEVRDDNDDVVAHDFDLAKYDRIAVNI